MKYSERIALIQKQIEQLQGCEDVEEGLEIYEAALSNLRVCDQTLDETRGRYEVLSMEFSAQKSAS